MTEILDEDLLKKPEEPTKNIGRLSLIYLVIMLLGGYILHVWFAPEKAESDMGRIFFHLFFTMVIAFFSELFDWIKKQRKGEKYIDPIWFAWWENTFFMWWFIAVVYVISYLKL
jgi:hypothetical protein